MMNYGIFTQIYVLQGFNAKEAKRVEKVSKMAKARKWKISRHNFTMSRQNPKAICRIWSQQSKLCHNKDKAECKMIVERLLRHFTTLSRLNMRRIIRKMSQHIYEYCNKTEDGRQEECRNT